jgi:hypothetical protein
MVRRLLKWLLRADFAPSVAWSDIATLKTEARISVEVKHLWSRTETLEQVLCECGDQYILFKRWLRSGSLSRVSFARSLDGREMRLTERPPGPPPVYRLQLSPAEGTAVTCDAARPTWFGLWRNEDPMSLGASICFIDSADRKLLADLRFKLLDGKIPESLRIEEEMWQRMHSMSDADRRAAYAALAMQALGEVDRQFNEIHPDIGPVPAVVMPAVENIEKRIREINQTALERPVDAGLADLMKRYVADTMHKESPTGNGPDPGDEPEENLTGKKST